MDKPIPKLIWNCKGSRKAKTTLKKNEAGVPALPDFERTTTLQSLREVVTA